MPGKARNLDSVNRVLKNHELLLLLNHFNLGDENQNIRHFYL